MFRVSEEGDEKLNLGEKSSYIGIKGVFSIAKEGLLIPFSLLTSEYRNKFAPNKFFRRRNKRGYSHKTVAN